MVPFGAAAEAFVDSGFAGQGGNHLRSSRDDDDFVADAPFDGVFVDFFHIPIVDVVVGDDRGDEDGVGVCLDCRVDDFVYGDGSAEVNTFDAEFFDAPVLDVDDFLSPTECSFRRSFRRRFFGMIF